jgi:four helix bundle protein
VSENNLTKRTKQFALGGIKLAETLPKSMTTYVIGRQLIRCSTSVGANYRAACCAKSKADFIAKMGIVEEECDETLYWMELLIESGVIKESTVADLIDEAKQLLAITVASIKTARKGK